MDVTPLKTARSPESPLNSPPLWQVGALLLLIAAVFAPWWDIPFYSDDFQFAFAYPASQVFASFTQPNPHKPPSQYARKRPPKLTIHLQEPITENQEQLSP